MALGHEQTLTVVDRCFALGPGQRLSLGRVFCASERVVLNMIVESLHSETVRLLLHWFVPEQFIIQIGRLLTICVGFLSKRASFVQ